MKYIVITICCCILLIAGCREDASVASQNLSRAADNFKIVRNIVFYNTWTDTEVMSLVGRCSIEDQNIQLEVVYKDGEGNYKKHFLGRSSNLTFQISIYKEDD